MKIAGCAAAAAACLCSAGAWPCELVLTEHRSGAELQRLPLDAQAPEVRIAFEHSVLGTPVVATAYSGNLDFMDERCALLVPATEVLIGPGHLYPAEGHWAEPDLDVAAAHLRALADDPALRQRLAVAGVERLRRDDVARVGDVAARRLRELGQGA